MARYYFYGRWILEIVETESHQGIFEFLEVPPRTREGSDSFMS